MRTPSILTLLIAFVIVTNAQTPPIEPGVSLELAKWRAAHYSDVRYKLHLTLEKMSPVLKGTMEIRVKVSEPPVSAGGGGPIVLDWRKIKGFEDRSTILNVSINGAAAARSSSFSWPPVAAESSIGNTGPAKAGTPSFGEYNEHLIFTNGVVAGENVIKLDFTSPILPSGSAVTRYVDKEDGAEYIYSLFVPSDASTAFPVFDQPDLKARFTLTVNAPEDWKIISNSQEPIFRIADQSGRYVSTPLLYFPETKPISTYVFAFAAGPFERVDAPGGNASVNERGERTGDDSAAKRPLATLPNGRVSASVSEPPALAGGKDAANGRADQGRPLGDASALPPAYAGGSDIYVRKSQLAKFKPHAAEVFRLNREAIKYFEEYFDYKFPWPKYDLVLIPEFPFGGMEHAGATFLREAAVIFPQEPTRNDHISRATLIFHEAAHQWFGDTVTMRWFDDLWLKEGFATFTAYKAMERIMPEMNPWKVFYERVKQAAYQTDSTRGTTPIYQEIKNLSAAKSAYGAIVYNKAPAFLRQAEFYLGEDKFRTAVRAFLKKHEFGNAGWEDLVAEFEASNGTRLGEWADFWVKRSGLTKIRITQIDPKTPPRQIPGYITMAPDWTSELQADGFPRDAKMPLMRGMKYARGSYRDERLEMGWSIPDSWPKGFKIAEYEHYFIFPNYKDYGYGIFLLDEKSREYVLKNIQNEKDQFLRAMMWGSLWDSVREGELDPREYVELVVNVLGTTARSSSFSWPPAGKEASRGNAGPAKAGTPNFDDESTTALLLARVGTALNYYIDAGVSSPHVSKGSSRPTDKVIIGSKSAYIVDGQPPDGQNRALTNVRATDTSDLRTHVEDLLIERMRNAGTVGQRITYYRAFLNAGSSDNARSVLKDILNLKFEISDFKLKTKDKFDIVTRLLILGDAEAEKLLAELEKTETSDDAKRYAYAARAGIGTRENKAKYWRDFTENKEISESWIEAAFGPWNSIRHSELTLGYLERALRELPNHKRNRKIFFVNGWLGAFIGGQRSEEALAIVNKFLADNPNLDNDLRLKILENVDIIERAVKIRKGFPQSRKGA